MVDIGDLIRQPHDLPLKSCRFSHTLVIADPIDDFPCEIQPLSVLFQHFHHAHALFVVFESARTHSVQSPLSGMTKGRMPEIMPQTDRFCQIFIQPQRLRDGPRIL